MIIYDKMIIIASIIIMIFSQILLLIEQNNSKVFDVMYILGSLGLALTFSLNKNPPKYMVMAQLVSMITIILATYGIREFRQNKERSKTVRNRIIPIILNTFGWILIGGIMIILNPSIKLYIITTVLLMITSSVLWTTDMTVLPVITDFLSWIFFGYILIK